MSEEEMLLEMGKNDIKPVKQNKRFKEEWQLNTK